MKSFNFLLSLSLLSACSLLLPHSGLAHNADVEMSFSDVGVGAENEITHEDDNPYKGWLNLTVTNNGTEAWGDFHFQIFNVPNYSGKVVFDIGPANAPSSSQELQSIHLSEDGMFLDLYFYADPILAGKSGTFSVYTDNTTNQLAYFGVAMYPTPVPVPNGAWLLLSGITAFAAMGRKTRA